MKPRGWRNIVFALAVIGGIITYILRQTVSPSPLSLTLGAGIYWGTFGIFLTPMVLIWQHVKRLEKRS